MSPLGIRRFRELFKIEEERADLMDGMSILIHARGHLNEDPLDGLDHSLATGLISSIVGPMENRNKDLAEKGGELWHKILRLDGQELSSPEIDREMQEAALGLEWLERIQRWILEAHPEGRGAEAVLVELSGLSTELHWRWNDLKQTQDEHQWTMAELLCRGPIGYQN